MKSYHLTCTPDDWELTESGSRTVIKAFATREQAVEASRAYVKEHSGSLKIHRTDGTIEEERTYPRSADPAGSPG